ncbi:MAG: hypothetical protein ABI682_08615 [Acidobacteriota bacterium]
MRFIGAVGLCLILVPAALTVGQTITVGMSLSNGGNVSVSGVETIVETARPATLSGRLTTATFGWSASPCPAAVKIRFFRPSTPARPIPTFDLVGERGPFAVNEPVRLNPVNGTLFATEAVMLTPPVDVQAGDVVAITNLTSCRGPVFANWVVLAPPPAGPWFAVQGDTPSAMMTPGTQRSGYIFLTASGTSASLGLIGNRFEVRLTATDPRTGAVTQRTPNLITDRSGYFSLPEFTGDSTFPEVIVKMVDATRSPALGGNYWFFHAPLTDVQYVITVTDLLTGSTKSYTNGSTGSGQLCGGVDTSAFRP